MIAKALSAGFHLVTQRARPWPVGSSDLVTRYRHFDRGGVIREMPPRPYRSSGIELLRHDDIQSTQKDAAPNLGRFILQIEVKRVGDSDHRPQVVGELVFERGI